MDKKDFDFNSILGYDEEILYQAKSLSIKGNRSFAGNIIVAVFCIIVFLLMFFSIKYKIGDGADGLSLTAIVIFLVDFLFFGIVTWDMLYRLFIKNLMAKDDFCCITNQRILKYEYRTGKLTSVNIADVDTFTTDNCYHGYGDAFFYKKVDHGELDVKETVKFGINIAKNSSNNITFLNVKNPKKAVGIVKQKHESLTAKNYKI